MSPFPPFLVSALVASLSAAHVVLENPKPYKFVSDGPTNPLSSTGSDFPCKIPPGQSYIVDGEPTPMTIGEDQMLSFSGQVSSLESFIPPFGLSQRHEFPQQAYSALSTPASSRNTEQLLL
ncbi:hypothetical protein GGS24DRAFT_454602 [Hypoxylon argillaceum]|nr:hypothetical protein GGS24DRAFT_454602 [Hypoxylon argillaceum]